MSSQHRALATPRVDLATCISGIVGRVEVGWRQLIQLRHGDASTVLLSFSFFSLRLQASSAPSEHDLEFVRTDLTSNECRVVNMRSFSRCFARLVPICVVSSHDAAGIVCVERHVLSIGNSRASRSTYPKLRTPRSTVERRVLNIGNLRMSRPTHIIASPSAFNAALTTRCSSKVRTLCSKLVVTRCNVSTARSRPYGEYTHVRTPRSNVCITSPGLVSAFTKVSAIAYTAGSMNGGSSIMNMCSTYAYSLMNAGLLKTH